MKVEYPKTRVSGNICYITWRNCLKTSWRWGLFFIWVYLTIFQSGELWNCEKIFAKDLPKLINLLQNIFSSDSGNPKNEFCVLYLPLVLKVKKTSDIQKGPCLAIPLSVLLIYDYSNIDSTDVRNSIRAKMANILLCPVETFYQTSSKNRWFGPIYGDM